MGSLNYVKEKRGVDMGRVILGRLYEMVAFMNRIVSFVNRMVTFVTRMVNFVTRMVNYLNEIKSKIKSPADNADIR
jgi:hypothetical protein